MDKIKGIIKEYFPFITYFVRGIKSAGETLYRLYHKLTKENIPYTCSNPFEKACRSRDKIILIAPACSGKSTFAERKDYKGIKLLDDVHKRWDKKGVYEEFRTATLREYPGKICALDPFFDINLERDIQHISVLIPKKKVIEYYKKRKELVHHACRLRDIVKLRKQILKFAVENNVPIYPSFEAALDDAVEAQGREE